MLFYFFALVCYFYKSTDNILVKRELLRFFVKVLFFGTFVDLKSSSLCLFLLLLPTRYFVMM
jgi:hypothetical protein